MIELSQRRTVKQIMQKYRIQPKKSLGQNFLADGNLLKKMVKEAGITKEDTVLEIGPGLGTLTRELAENAKKVIAVEIDGNLEAVHGETLKDLKNVELIYKDFLTFDLETLKTEGKIKSVSNLPYYISSKIIAKLLENHEKISEITVLTQKEMAERILNEKSSFTTFIDYYAEKEMLFKIPPQAFIPQPKVESRIIKLTIKKELPPVGEKFFELIRNAYAMKRKTLINNLLKSGDFNDRSIAEKTLKTLQIPLNARAEDLRVEQFIKLSFII